jgi:hypothetical protein
VKKIQGGGEAKKDRRAIVDGSEEDDIADFLDDAESESDDYDEEDILIKSKRGVSKATGKTKGKKVMKKKATRKVRKDAAVKTNTKGVVKAKGGGKKKVVADEDCEKIP